MKYFLGVDGGNTKTDYLLCDGDGKFIDVYRAGTCSHEAFGSEEDENGGYGGYKAMEREMRKHLKELFSRNNILIEDIAAAGFGLAGADLPKQVKELKERVSAIGFSKFGLFNDGILGVKTTESGIGLCAVNGTGTVIVAANEKGDILQVGGVGGLSGDYAGGGYIASRIVALTYDYYYRAGDKSSIFEKVLDITGYTRENLLELVGEDHGRIYSATKELIRLADVAAMNGDKVAQTLFLEVGSCVGKSAAGAIRAMSFDRNVIEAVLVGSIWRKVEYKGLKEAFLKEAQDLSGKELDAKFLDAPPAVGGVLWAKELSVGSDPEFRKTVLHECRMEVYDERAGV